MLRTSFVFVLAAAALAKDADPVDEKFKEHAKKELASRWGAEPLAEMRFAMVRELERHDAPAAAEWLLTKAMQDEAANVVREAARVLSTYKRPPTVQHMAEVWQKKLKKQWETRALALLAFARIKLDSARGPIALGLADRDPRVVVAACRAAGAARLIDRGPDLRKLLKHKHPAVRGAACLGLAELGGEEALPEIFRVFCSDRSNRARYDAWLALKTLTLETLPCDPEQWRAWWEKMAGSWNEADGPTPWGRGFPKLSSTLGKPGSFFRIPVMGDRVIFVLDVSLDMDNPFLIDVGAERKKKAEDRIPNFFSVKTRWDLIRNYVKRTLEQMPEGTGFALVFFSQEIATFPEAGGKLLKNSKKTRSLAVKAMEEKERSGSTAIYEALAAAWGFVRGGNPKHNFEKGADTLVFVTDGMPRAGALENKSDRIADEVWRVAAPRNLRVHTVGLHNHDFALCAAMARATNGLYVHAQQKGDTAEPQDLDFWPEKKKAFEASRKKKPGR